MIAQVIVDVVHTNVDRPFSYRIPDGMEVKQGSRVSVPLGKRRVDGFVVALLEEDQLPADVPLLAVGDHHASTALCPKPCG